MNAAEAGAFQFLFDLLQGTFAKVALGGGDDVDQFALGLKCDDLGWIEEVEIGSAASDNFARRRGGIGQDGPGDALELALGFADGFF